MEFELPEMMPPSTFVYAIILTSRYYDGINSLTRTCGGSKAICY
jgi:hypothetical protein